jgi:DME family drug/metabolite transporter
VLFGTSGTAIELGPDAATPLGVGAVRISIGVVVLWAAIALSNERRTVVAALGGSWPLMVLGGLGVATYTPSFFEAVERTGVAIGTVVTIGSGPFVAGALEWGWRGVRPSRGWVVGTVVTVTGGAVLIAAQSNGTDPADAGGIAFALLAGGGYALYSVTSKTTMTRGASPALALAGPFTVGVLVVVVLAVGQPYGWLGTGAGVAMALQLGVAATGVAYLLFGYGLYRLTTATTVTLVLAEPLTATLLATVVLDESITGLGWLGVAVLLTGLIVVGRTAEVSIEPVPPR